MPTFRFKSERPYYQDGRLRRKVTTQHNLRLSATDCAVLGWNVARLLGKLTLALMFRRNPYGLF